MKNEEIDLNGGLEAATQDNKSDDGETCWKSVKIAGVVAFLAAVENTVVGMGEWPYMHTIDPEATSAFFGSSHSASKGGRIAFSLLFSFWVYKTHKVRPALIAGRILAFIGCVLYLGVEFLPSGRRYLMMFCYVMFGIASSSSAVLRVYLVAVSSLSDRGKAFAAIALANTLSIVVGPVCQLVFSGIQYPGFRVLPNISFHLYSAPVWVATILNFVSIAVILMFLEEKLEPPKNKELDEDNFSVNIIFEKLQKLRAMDIAWSLLLLCCLEKFIVALTPSTIMTVGAPLKMAVFNWDGPTTVRYTSGSMAACGILAICVTSLLVKSPFCKKISAPILFLFGISISIFMYVGSYPVGLWGGPIPKYNATTGAGCNSLEYSWCDTATTSPPYIYIPVVILTLGIALPILHISLDTVYSRVLGNVDQSLMQGIIVAVEDFIMVVGPLYASAMFTHYGQAPLWFANGLITIIGVVIWIFYLKKLKKYN